MARPIVPATTTSRQPRVHRPTYAISRAQPAHHFARANRGSPSSHAGRAWKPSPTMDGEGVCVQPAPSVVRRRGVGDAAPYGRSRNVGIRIVGNRCVNAANLRPPLGSPERGAVAVLCAVTEGLVQGGCGETMSSVIPRRAGGNVSARNFRCPPLRGGARCGPGRFLYAGLTNFLSFRRI